MTRWIIKFRRAMRPENRKDERVFGRCVIGWTPISDSISYKIKLRYWDSKYKMWSSGRDSAYEYTSLERAERMAFKLVSKDPSLVGEVEVVEVTVPEKLKP